MTPRHSLRRLLLLWLLPPVGIMLALSMLGDYEIAKEPATAAYDQVLKDNAMILKDHVHEMDNGDFSLKLTPEADVVLRTEQYDRVYYALYDDNGHLVANTPEFEPKSPLSWKGNKAFYDIVWHELPMRLYMQHVKMGDKGLYIEVADTTNKRKALSGRIVFAMFVPEVLTVASIMIVLWIGVARGLAPLERLQKMVADSAPHDLTQLPESQTPSEIYGLVHKHNVQTEKLHEAQGMQERFITNAAHQLRTPLAGLQTQSELALKLIDNHAPAGELQRIVQNINTAAVRASRLVQQLLGLARSSASAEAFVGCDLATLAEHVAGRFVHRAVDLDIDLGLELESATVEGIPTLLEELLSNLLDNALHYCPRHSSITLQTRSDAQGSRLVVEDNGPGIPAAEREKIFERFYRLSTSTEGAGLGLAIVKEIAELHGASVALQTGQSGKGLRVEVVFPLKA